MCIIVDARIEQACGYLLLNDFNAFVYCCTMCHCEFEFSVNLEAHIYAAHAAHILQKHQDDKEHIENVFVNEDLLFDGAESSIIEIGPTTVKIEQDETNVEDNEANVGDAIAPNQENSEETFVRVPIELKEGNKENDALLSGSVVSHVFENGNKNNEADKVTHNDIDDESNGIRRSRRIGLKRRRYGSFETKTSSSKKPQNRLVTSKRRKISCGRSIEKSIPKRYNGNTKKPHTSITTKSQDSKEKSIDKSQLNEFTHWPKQDDKKSRSRCKLCTMKGIANYTFNFCTQCNIHLCCNGHRSCFRDYHLHSLNKNAPNSFESPIDSSMNSKNKNMAESTFGNTAHWPKNDEKYSRSRCKMKGCNNYTHNFCTNNQCNVHLCYTRHRNCFREYHKPLKQKEKQSCSVDPAKIISIYAKVE